MLDGEGADRCAFTPFDPDGSSEAHHVLTLAFDRGLDGLSPGPVGLRLQTADPGDAPAAAAALAAGCAAALATAGACLTVYALVVARSAGRR